MAETSADNIQRFVINRENYPNDLLQAVEADVDSQINRLPHKKGYLCRKILPVLFAGWIFLSACGDASAIDTRPVVPQPDRIPTTTLIQKGESTKPIDFTKPPDKSEKESVVWPVDVLNPQFFWDTRFLAGGVEKSEAQIQATINEGIGKGSFYGEADGVRLYNYIDFTDTEVFDQFKGIFADLDLSNLSQREKIEQISKIYTSRPGGVGEYGENIPFYKELCFGASLDTFAALWQFAEMKSVFLDVLVDYEDSYGSYGAYHSVLGVKLDGNWYIIDNSSNDLPIRIDDTGKGKYAIEPVILSLAEYLEYYSQKKGVTIAKIPLAVPIDGDPFNLNPAQDMPDMIDSLPESIVIN